MEIMAYTASGFSRGQKSTVGRAGVWIGPGDGTQDVGLFRLRRATGGESHRSGRTLGAGRRIHAILEEDQTKPAKQRHTAQRIFYRLAGGARVYRRLHDRKGLRASRRAAPPRDVRSVGAAPGTAQADFGEASAIVGGEQRKAHYFAIDLPHSDDCFVTAFSAETTERFWKATFEAFAYFGGVPSSILYDNTKLAVARILGDGTRQKTRALELQSHYLFAEKFGRPARGDEGNVEGLVGYARRNFLVPVPRFASWEGLNVYLREQCRQRRETAGSWRSGDDRRTLCAGPGCPSCRCRSAR